MCIVSGIGWNIYVLTGTKSVSKSLPLTGILRFKMLIFHVSHPSLVVYPLHVALMKFSLRCVISWHPWMSPKLVVMMVSLPEC